VNSNELFAGQMIEDSKCFLRLHIDREGTLTVYPVAVDKVSRRWRVTPDGAPDSPWLEPEDPLTVRPAGEPIVLAPRQAPTFAPEPAPAGRPAKGRRPQLP
jgi:hypothetical protein